jgi:sugar transferase (PEP-CTERM/EpsH1 system associated)
MKLLFTANRFPYPPYRGDKLKIYHLARRLARRHEVHLLTFLQDKSDLQYLPELEKIFTEIHLVPLSRAQSYFNSARAFFHTQPFQVRYFHSAAMHQKVQELYATHQYDAVHVQHLRMAPYWATIGDVPRILDLPDAYSLYWKRRIAAKSGLMKWFATLEQKRVFDYEAVLEAYDLSLVCSGEDRNYLQQERGIKNVRLLPNGVDMETFSGSGHDYNRSDLILFTGNMDYAPNVDAVIYFLQEIFPAIKRECPHTRFMIAGQRPVAKVRELASADVVVTGFVPELSEVYAQASLVVAPLRFGAGTQNKVLEAMAMGVPVVSHKIGFDGLNVRSGEGVVLAMDKASFSRECIRLLQSASLRKAVGEAGSEVIRTQFDWEVVSRQLEQYFADVVANKSAVQEK